MGLDMYLTKRTHIGANYKHNEVNGSVELTKNNAPITIKVNRIAYIDESVGYWRKANCIHKWFVENCQEGIDECQETEVSTGNLKKLLALCKFIKKDPEKAPELLPVQPGFFFGSYEYDEYYIRHLDNTIKILSSLLKELEEDNNSTVYYSSSW